MRRTDLRASYLTEQLHRFMMEPRPDMEKSLKDEEKTLTDDLNNLGKKVWLRSFCPATLRVLTADKGEVSGKAVHRRAKPTTRYRGFIYTIGRLYILTTATVQ